MFAPGIPRILDEFNERSSTTATFILSVYILGFAFGPLIVAPMSEIYGRSLLYNLGNVFFTIFSVGTALSNSIGMMMAFRFLMGLAGSVPITIGSGSIADMMPVQMRGRAMAAWALGPLLGPCIGPVAGGYLIRAAGWRWCFWLITIVAGVITVFAFFTLRESYAPVILERKAARLRKETGNMELRSALANNSVSPATRLKMAIIRPLKLLCLTPIVTLMALYVAITCQSLRAYRSLSISTDQHVNRRYPLPLVLDFQSRIPSILWLRRGREVCSDLLHSLTNRDEIQS